LVDFNSFSVAASSRASAALLPSVLSAGWLTGSLAGCLVVLLLLLYF
jgi:hypothetical protein